jgi:hypothetical protein
MYASKQMNDPSVAAWRPAKFAARVGIVVNRLPGMSHVIHALATDLPAVPTGEQVAQMITDRLYRKKTNLKKTV